MATIFQQLVASRRFCSGLQLGSNLLGNGGTFDKSWFSGWSFGKSSDKGCTGCIRISGPFGLIISLIVSFVTAWMKTGDLSAGGITQVFDNLGNTITSVTTMLAANHRKLYTFTTVLTSILGKITEAIPRSSPRLSSLITLIVCDRCQFASLIEAATQIITLIQGITTVLPMLIEVGLSLLMTLVNAIVTALPTITTAAINIITTLVTAFVSVTNASLSRCFNYHGLGQCICYYVTVDFDCWFTNFDGINHWDYDDFTNLSCSYYLNFDIGKCLIGACHKSCHKSSAQRQIANGF